MTETTITINDLISFADYMEDLATGHNAAAAEYLDTNDKQALKDFIAEYKSATCEFFTGNLQCAAIKKTEQLVCSARVYING